MNAMKMKLSTQCLAIALGLVALAAAAQAQTTLNNNVAVTGISGAAGSQKFYKIAVPSGQSKLEIKIYGGSGDCDLYVKRGSSPTTSSWDYRPYLSGNNETVTVNNPAGGDWFIMLRGYAAYSGVTLLAKHEAPVVPTPVVSPLSNGVPVNGLSGNAASEKHFKISVPSGQAKLEIKIYGGSGDCDLYVKRGSQPTTTSWDYLPYVGGNNETVTVNNPANGDWFIMLRGYAAYSGVSLVAGYTPPVVITPPPVTVTPLQNGVAVTGLSGSASSEKYYKLNVPAGQTKLEIKIYGGTGDADLYVQRGSMPTTTSWFQPNGRPYLSGNDETVTVTSPASGDWFIMVRGWAAYSGVTLVASYGNIIQTTSFAVPEDTWGQTNPNYCSLSGHINQILCWSPVSNGGSCYGIATMELRWFKIRQTSSVSLPRLRSLYDFAPAWVQSYTAGLVQNLTALANVMATLITNLQNGTVQASGVKDALVAQISAGKPVLVIQRGKNWSGQWVGHAVVAYGYEESATEVKFRIADSNYPDTPQTLTFNKASGTWSYYWSWSEFRIGAIPLDLL